MRTKIILLMAIFTLLQVSFTYSQTIYQWRNTDRSGIYDETNLLKSWPENGPELLWETEIVGNGYGSPIFTAEKMYILGEIDEKGYLFAFDLKGKLLWKKEYGKEWTQSYQGTRSTPTIVGDLMYFSSGMGDMFCYTTEGELKWKKEFIKDFEGQYPMFGHSESLIVKGNKVFFTPGGKEKNVVALNRLTGENIWECKALGERSGYNPPNIIELPNRDILVTFSAYALLGIDMETGKLLWSHLQDNVPKDKRRPGAGDTHSNTILYKDGFIYYVAGDGNCAVKLKLSKDGSEIKQIWRNKDFDNYMGGNVIIDNHIYGSGTAKKHLISVNINSGEIADFLTIGSGSLIAADGLLYYYNQRGQVNLVKPTGGKMELLSSFKITKGTKEHFAHPVINKGILYIRHGKAFMAFNIKQK